MITFMTTLYNEEKEAYDLIAHIAKHVDYTVIVDDGSTDKTILEVEKAFFQLQFKLISSQIIVPIEHTGVCELGRIKALEYVPDNSWVILLDADERFDVGVLTKVVAWINSDPKETHMYFDQIEYLDGSPTRSYQKVKVFKKESAHLPELVHGDPQFDGDPVSFGWKVIHRKTSTKQIEREQQYVELYQRLINEGKIDEAKRDWYEGMHYFVKHH